MIHYNEDDVASMTDAEIQAVLHTPDYQRFLAQVEARWDQEPDDRITNEFLAELVAIEPEEEYRSSEKVNWTKEGF